MESIHFILIVVFIFSFFSSGSVFAIDVEPTKENFIAAIILYLVMISFIILIPNFHHENVALSAILLSFGSFLIAFGIRLKYLELELDLNIQTVTLL